jgi:homoserine O-acetyltransferase
LQIYGTYVPYFARNLEIGSMNYFQYEHSFELEGGGILTRDYGRLPYVWPIECRPEQCGVGLSCVDGQFRCGALVAGVVGDKGPIHPDRYFIVCANILGSCYGSTGPLSVDPLTDEPYYRSFPVITIRDMVKAHILLRKHLGIDQIHLLMGGSMGGYQALEWCVMEKEVIGRLFLTATSPGGECLGDSRPYGAAAGHRGGSQLAAAGAGGRP